MASSLRKVKATFTSPAHIIYLLFISLIHSTNIYWAPAKWNHAVHTVGLPMFNSKPLEKKLIMREDNLNRAHKSSGHSMPWPEDLSQLEPKMNPWPWSLWHHLHPALERVGLQIPSAQSALIWPWLPWKSRMPVSQPSLSSHLWT